MIRAVIDTNVLISGLLTNRGYTGQIVEALLQDRFKVVVSYSILTELMRVCALPKLSSYPSIGQRGTLLAVFLSLIGEIYPGVVHQRVIADDPDDDFVLACAIEGEADYIVTGDHHLLELEQHQGVQIITPKEFAELLENENSA